MGFPIPAESLQNLTVTDGVTRDLGAASLLSFAESGPGLPAGPGAGVTVPTGGLGAQPQSDSESGTDRDWQPDETPARACFESESRVRVTVRVSSQRLRRWAWARRRTRTRDPGTPPRATLTRTRSCHTSPSHQDDANGRPAGDSA